MRSWSRGSIADLVAHLWDLAIATGQPTDYDPELVEEVLAHYRGLDHSKHARMSGTATGTVVLHVAPEAAVGGPLALVRDGDLIRLDVEAGVLDLLVDATELGLRRADVTLPGTRPRRGFDQLHWDHVLQASQGCDFDFLRG